MPDPPTAGSSPSGAHGGEPFFSGPFESTETERLLEAIDARLRLRASFDIPPPSQVGRWAPSDDAAGDARLAGVDAVLVPNGLTALAAPYFNVERGGRAVRAVRALLNLPLRLFGRPQAYFNDELRRILSSWAAMLRASTEMQTLVERRVALQAEQLERLAHRETALAEVVEELRQLLADSASRRPVTLAGASAGPRHGDEAASGGPSVALDHHSVPAGRIDIHLPAGGSTRVTADPAALPFRASSIGEIVVHHMIERFPEREVAERILPSWHALLRRGGLLRVVCCDWEAALDRYRAGNLDAQRLRAITFGSGNGAAGHMAMYTPSALVALLEGAGFVDCTLSLLPSTSHGCPEMQVVAARPAT